MKGTAKRLLVRLYGREPEELEAEVENQRRRIREREEKRKEAEAEYLRIASGIFGGERKGGR